MDVNITSYCGRDSLSEPIVLHERKCTSRSSNSNCGRLGWSTADLLQQLGGADSEGGVER